MHILKSLNLLNTLLIWGLLSSAVRRAAGFLYCTFVGKRYFVNFSLVNLGSLSLDMVLLFDPISLAFLFSVRTIAAAVISFAKSYIRGETHFARFSLLVMSFVGSIFLIILSPNLMRVLLGWDGLGVTSYLLVIYYLRTKSYNAGIVTALTNRVGDVAILVLIALVLSQGSWNYFIQALEQPASAVHIGAAVITLAAMTKRAQIPFSAWLPAAMAAPTPVSALVHSSTLVTAGVYLLIRFNLLLVDSLYIWMILFSGSITMLMAGIRAIFEIDIKKIVALSTLSQLGLIISAIGIGRVDIAFFHLLTHAYFKALLFMCAGNLIHCRNDYQDLRQIGYMATNLPVTTRFITLSNIRLCGLPFLAGFYSKDMFLEIALLSPLSFSAVVLFFAATLLTAAYSLRFTILTALRAPHATPVLWSRDEDRVITRGMWILLPLAIMGGSLLRWGLFSTPALVVLPLVLKLGAVIVTAGGILLSTVLANGNTLPGTSGLRWTSATMWMLVQITSRTWLKPSLPISWSLRRLADNSVMLISYHQGPQSLSGTVSGSLEGARSVYSKALVLTFIWTAVLASVLLTFYSCT